MGERVEWPGGPAEAAGPATVSVVIISFNSEEFIDACLDSLERASTGRYPVDVIVVDNASTDGTLARLRARPGPPCVVENGTNLGFAKAANVGIRRASGSYVLLLNPDTVLPSGAIDAGIQFMETHPGAGVYSPRLVLQDGSIDPGCHRGFPTPWASFTYLAGLERLFPRWRLFNGYHRWDLPLDEVHEVDAVSGAFMLVRRTALCDAGLLDERFFMYAEDVDLCMRVRDAGYRVYYDPGTSVLHVKGTSSGIKRHSSGNSRANLETRQRALNAFYDSTKAFYDKHYAGRYPRPLKWAVHLTVEAARPLANWRLRRRMRGLNSPD